MKWRLALLHISPNVAAWTTFLVLLTLALVFTPSSVTATADHEEAITTVLTDYIWAAGEPDTPEDELLALMDEMAALEADLWDTSNATCAYYAGSAHLWMLLDWRADLSPLAAFAADSAFSGLPEAKNDCLVAL